MIYGQPETLQFLAAVKHSNGSSARKEQQTRQAKRASEPPSVSFASANDVRKGST